MGERSPSPPRRVNPGSRLVLTRVGKPAPIAHDESRAIRGRNASGHGCAAPERALAPSVAAAQAEAHAEAVCDAVVQGFASKADIQRLEDRFGETASKADLAEIKVTMPLSVFGAAGAPFAALRPFGDAP